MKKIITILLITITATVVQAQERTFTQLFDSVFMNVSRTSATTGILYNRVLPFSGLSRFTALDTANSEVFKQAYSELYRAAFLPLSKLPFDADSLENLLSTQQNIVDIGVLHYKYNMLNESTIWQKIYFDQDSVIRENTNTITSLYTEETAFMVSPLKEQVNGLSVTFNFRNLFVFDNTNNPITQLFADFQDGNGLQMVNINAQLTVAYATGGNYTLKFVAVLSNNDTLTTYSQIDIIDPNQPKSAPSGQTSNWPWIDKYDGENGNYSPITAKIDIPVYGSSSGFNKGHVWIYYAKNDRKLRKPILIVDGFDPENPRKFESHKKENESDADNLRCYSIWKLLEYKNKQGVTVNFGRELLSDYDYDLVVLDLPDGGGYIERNAMVCIEVINFINQRLQESGSQHEIVVVGPSMGGQITRFALAYMDNPANHNVNTNFGKHNCRLWISYDSPHQGANISMGAQAFIQQFGEKGGAFGFNIPNVKEVWEKTICCIAAKQMLIHHKASGAGTYYRQWTANRKNAYSVTNGYPLNLRKISVANGSLNNTLNGVPHQIAFEVVYPLVIATLDIRIRHAVNLGEGEVFGSTYWMLNIIPFHIIWTFNNDTGKCSPDAAPGGSYNTFDQIAAKVDKNLIVTNKSTHCFMPFTSVLDISGNMDYCTDISNRDLVDEGLTPFDSYAGSTDNNMYHVTFNGDLVDYLTDEIETYIKPGKRTISLCDTAQYTVNFPAGTTNTVVTWTHSPNLQIVSGQNTKTIIVKALSTGDGWVKAEPNLLDHGNNHKKELKPYNITVTYPQSATQAPAQITSNQIWSTSYLAENDITISNGATLTLANTATLYVAEGRKITIQPGAKLVINGATLINACPNTMWQGIIVSGNTGSVEIKNNGKIQNAICGITVNGGSIVATTGAQFINNQAGVKFNSSTSSGSFTQTRFILNSNYFGNTANFEAHLKMENSGTVSVTGCSFSSHITLNPNKGVVVSNASTNWAGNDTLLSVPVALQTGATLTNTGTIKSNANTVITVQPGGNLIINGGTLTNATAGTLWQGVTITGNQALPLHQQGEVILMNSGKIENAKCGIEAITGGLVDANNAHFVNNTTGVLLRSERVTGSFTKTRFELNNNYFGETGVGSLGDTRDFVAHIKGQSYCSIGVTGCAFSSTAPQSSNFNRNNGISAINTNLVIKEYCQGLVVIPPLNTCQDKDMTKTTFTGFSNAVSVENSGFAPIVKVRFTTFEDNYKNALVLDGVNYLEALKNDFIVSQPNSYGLNLNNCTGYKIEENTFKDRTLVPGKGNTGTLISASGSAENEIYKNEYQNLSIAQRFSGKNSSQTDTAPCINCPPNQKALPILGTKVTGLQILCNNFRNNQSQDMLAGYLANMNSIRLNQGSSQKPAGNQFKTTPLYNIDYALSQHDINYYYDMNASYSYPNNVTPNVSRYSTPSSNGCPSQLGSGEVPNRGDNTIDIDKALAQYDEWNKEYTALLNKLTPYKGDDEEEYNRLLDMLSYYSALKDNYFNWIIVEVSGEDEMIGRFEDEMIGRYKKLRYLFAYRGQYVDYLSITETYLAEYNYNEALTTLEKMHKLFEITEEEKLELSGLQTYTNWLQQLYKNERNIYELSDKELDYLIKFVEAHTGRSVVFVNNILCALYNICLEKEEGAQYATSGGDEMIGGLDDEVINQSKSAQSESSEFKNNALENITLVPNPTTGELRITNYELRIEDIEIFDVYGKKLLSNHLIPTSSNHLINIFHLQAGIYFVRIQTETGIITKKIIKL